MNRATIDDIARHAGVCKATVTRTLRSPNIVSEKTRSKVLSAVKELNYTPDIMAASLRSGKSRNIFVMLPDITNPFFSPIVRAIEKEAFARDYSVLIGDTLDKAEHESTYSNLIRSRQADGVITTSQRYPFDEGLDKQYEGAIPPLVSTAEIVDNENVHRIEVDNVQVAKMATKHLLSLGHKRIVAIAGPPQLKTCQDRLKGFREAMAEAGETVLDEHIAYGDYSTASGVECTAQFLKGSIKPTAIFCLGDMAALGALYCLYDFGLSVPKDISVIGVDGIELGQFSIPPLTTVAQPLDLIGQRCAKVLIDIIEGNVDTVFYEQVPHTLIVRDSTGPNPELEMQ